MPDKDQKRRNKLQKIKTEIKKKGNIKLSDIKRLHSNGLSNDRILLFIKNNKISIHHEVLYLMAFT